MQARAELILFCFHVPKRIGVRVDHPVDAQAPRHVRVLTAVKNGRPVAHFVIGRLVNRATRFIFALYWRVKLSVTVDEFSDALAGGGSPGRTRHERGSQAGVKHLFRATVAIFVSP